MGTPNAGLVGLPSAWKWCVGAAVGMWVSTPAMVQALIVLMCLDYASGVICALSQHTWCAREGWRGLAQKTLTLLLVGTLWYVARPMHLGIDVASVVSAAFAFNELCSVVRNCARAGVDIPDPLVDALVKMRKLTGRNRTVAEVEAALDQVEEQAKAKGVGQ